MIPIPASILAIENESDRDFMENIFFSYQRLIYHEIGSILNDPWSKDDIFQTVIVQLINNIDTLRPMPAKVLTSYIATSARNAALTHIRNISRRKEVLADEFDNNYVDADHDTDPEFILLKSEEINSFAKVWDELDDKTKFLLSSRYILEKSYAENHLEDSNLVLFTTTVYDAPDSSIDMCASANRDLRDQLVNLLGTDIYPSKERHRESYQGVTFTVYEQLTFDIRSVQNVSWSTPITVASLIVGYLGKVVKEPLVVTICSVFGVVLDAASYLPAGKSLNRYRCAGLYSHYTQASGSSKVYNRTYRYVYYEGYEEVDGYLRAQIDSSSKTVEFDKGQSYYYDYPLQVQDAYQSYKIMG